MRRRLIRAVTERRDHAGSAEYRSVTGQTSGWTRLYLAADVRRADRRRRALFSSDTRGPDALRRRFGALRATPMRAHS